MGKQYLSINEKLTEFIIRQQIFFVATAAVDGRINLSPKGMDSLRIVSPNQVVWLNLTGSGNETAAHLLENDRMTLMFCAFEGDPQRGRLSRPVGTQQGQAFAGQQGQGNPRQLEFRQADMQIGHLQEAHNPTSARSKK